MTFFPSFHIFVKCSRRISAVKFSSGGISSGPALLSLLSLSLKSRISFFIVRASQQIGKSFLAGSISAGRFPGGHF